MVIAINEQIKNLVELQKFDGEIYRLKTEIAVLPSRRKKMELDSEKKKAGLRAAEEQLKGIQLSQKQKEMDLQTREEKIKKLQGQLYQLKSNKEYTAMELEIKGLKADKSLLEEEILELLDRMDQVKTKVAQEKELFSADEKKAKEELEVLKKGEGEAQQKVSELQEKRKVHLPNIDVKLLVQYEKVLKSREGLALVPVRNNACSGCHMGLPPQVVNEIQLQDKLVVCESCARILY